MFHHFIFRKISLNKTLSNRYLIINYKYQINPIFDKFSTFYRGQTKKVKINPNVMLQCKNQMNTFFFILYNLVKFILHH